VKVLVLEKHLACDKLLPAVVAALGEEAKAPGGMKIGNVMVGSVLAGPDTRGRQVVQLTLYASPAGLNLIKAELGRGILKMAEGKNVLVSTLVWGKEHGWRALDDSVHRLLLGVPPDWTREDVRSVLDAAGVELINYNPAGDFVTARLWIDTAFQAAVQVRMKQPGAALPRLIDPVDAATQQSILHRPLTLVAESVPASSAQATATKPASSLHAAAAAGGSSQRSIDVPAPLASTAPPPPPPQKAQAAAALPQPQHAPASSNASTATEASTSQPTPKRRAAEHAAGQPTSALSWPPPTKRNQNSELSDAASLGVHTRLRSRTGAAQDQPTAQPPHPPT
jgi:hypothetical protein